MTPTTQTRPLATHHCDTLRDALRHALVDRALAEHMSPTPQRVLDVGGGTGVQGRMLAERGHHVLILDPDEEMLARAQSAWPPHSEGVPGSIAYRAGPGERAADLVGTGWDAVLCHGVLMNQIPPPLLRTVARCVRPGGLVSVVGKEETASAMRHGLHRDWPGFLHALTGPEKGSDLLGTTSRVGVVRQLVEHGVYQRAWYGACVLTDHLADDAITGEFEQILEAEWQAGISDPYRRIARLFHIVARAQLGTR
ncbi:methyltransferase domain-containing protein [Streptomyces sp. AJS327]|uniref:class I SAM-dependent methyltransferase n=1 Tax=Streptomyces sp. AJS327 TaxID=2545265 RepID=UPI0015DD96EC|nr:methyltransferase domain-containing protein [Streptomyces sp. AJS327]MBA0049753.1 methyltransferase domain-containing protein [Streptomyces sp. AJS327]